MPLQFQSFLKDTNELKGLNSAFRELPMKKEDGVGTLLTILHGGKLLIAFLGLR